MIFASSQLFIGGLGSNDLLIVITIILFAAVPGALIWLLVAAYLDRKRTKDENSD